jgi:hypothetical protein
VRQPHSDAWQLLARLDGAAPARRSPSRVAGELIATVLTLGLWPAFTLPRRLRAGATQQRAILAAVATWSQRYASAAEAEELSANARATGVSLLAVVSMYAMSLVAAAGVVVGVAVAPGWTPSSLAGWVNGFTYGVGLNADPIQVAAFAVWAGGLFSAFAIALVAHARQAHHVRCFLDTFNRITALRESLPPVYLPPTLLGLSPAWLLTATVLLALRQPWGIPLAMAGGALARYDRRAWPEVRQELAERVRAMVLHNPPASRQSLTSARPTRLPRCGTVGCGGVMPAGAQFCGRCGSAVVAGPAAAD